MLLTVQVYEVCEDIVIATKNTKSHEKRGNEDVRVPMSSFRVSLCFLWQLLLVEAIGLAGLFVLFVVNPSAPLRLCERL